MDGDVPGSETDSSAVSFSSRVMLMLQLDSDVFSLSDSLSLSVGFGDKSPVFW